jgi:hypothetical protein
MFKFVPDTGVPGFRVGLPEGLDQRTPASATDAGIYDYYPYGDATLASGDPSGVGTNPPNIFISPWSRPARPKPLETIPGPDPGPGVAPPPPPRLRLWPWPPIWPDDYDSDPMRKLPPAPSRFPPPMFPPPSGRHPGLTTPAQCLHVRRSRGRSRHRSDTILDCKYFIDE